MSTFGDNLYNKKSETQEIDERMKGAILLLEFNHPLLQVDMGRSTAASATCTVLLYYKELLFSLNQPTLHILESLKPRLNSG